MNVKDLFKKIVRQAQTPFGECPEGQRPIITYGSQHKSDFITEKKHVGKFSHLNDEYIDSLSDEKLEEEFVLFIYRCFQSR